MYKGLQTKSDTESVHNMDLDISVGGDSNVSVVDDNDNDDNVSEYRDAEDMGGLMHNDNDEDDDDYDEDNEDDIHYYYYFPNDSQPRQLRCLGTQVTTFVNDHSNNLSLGTKVTRGSINGGCNRHHHNSDPSQTLTIAMQGGPRYTSTHKDVD